MPAPTISKPAAAPASGAPASGSQPAPALIPFTRAARKKSRLIGTIGPTTLTTSAQTLAPVQVPANGYLKRIILDVTITSVNTSSPATVAWANDGPFNVLTQVSLSAANGDSLINPLDGFALAMVNKYGCFGTDKADPVSDPQYSKVSGTTNGGNAHFQVNIPVEIDPRDAMGALPNMAANQSFLLQLSLNSVASLFPVTGPTGSTTVTIVMTAEYWAAPAATNQAGVAQQTAPRCANTVSLIQTQSPTISPSTDQQIQLLNVGNTIRWIMFILRTSAGARDSADWPNQGNLLVNNDYWYYKTNDNWLRQMAQEFGYTAGVATSPTLNSLDTGVYVITDFFNDGGQGSRCSSSANRDLLLVTGSATALYFEANTWGASASSLQVITNSIRVPDPASFYAPLGI